MPASVRPRCGALGMPVGSSGAASPRPCIARSSRRCRSPGRASSSPSASRRPGRRPATATSMPAHRCPERPGCAAPTRFLEKPERAGAAEACSPRAAGTGTAASSCSGPIAFSPSWARTLRPFSRRPSAAYAALSEVPGGAFEVPQDAYACGARGADRQGGDGTRRADRRAAVRSRMVRSRLVAGALGAAAARMRAATPCAATAFLDGSTDCLVHAESRMVACAGVRDLAVIETPDAVLVSDRRDTDAGRRLVALLQQAGRSRGDGARRGAAPLGQLPRAARGAGLQGQGDRGRARRPAQPAKPRASRRALGGGHRYRARHRGRRGL